MTVLTQDLRTTAHHLVSEANGFRSRGTGTIASGSGVLVDGAVLGTVTASGEYAPFDPAAEDGSETASAILYEGCDATSAAVRRTLSLRDCEVTEDELVWGAGVTAPQKSAALASLAALGIIAR